jgi:excisionase family DNA binding protein
MVSALLCRVEIVQESVKRRMDVDNREEWLSVKEVARELQTTTRTVYLYIKTGRLPAQKLGASYCVRREALQQLQRPRVGREKLQPAEWRRRSDQVVTTIRLRVREGQRAQLAQQLKEIRAQQRYLLPGTCEQKIAQSRDDPTEIMLIFTWRTPDMPAEAERLRALVHIRNELDRVLEWEEAEMFEGAVLLHT